MEKVLLSDKIPRSFGETASLLYMRGPDGGDLIRRQPVQVAVYPGTGRVLVTGTEAQVLPAQSTFIFNHLAANGTDSILEVARAAEARVLLGRVGREGSVEPVVDVHVHIPTTSWSSVSMPWAGPMVGLALLSAMTRRQADMEVIVLGSLNIHGSLGNIGGEEILTVKDVELLHGAGFRKILLPHVPQQGHPALVLAAARGMTVGAAEYLTHAMPHVLQSLAVKQRRRSAARASESPGSSDAANEGEEEGPE